MLLEQAAGVAVVHVQPAEALTDFSTDGAGRRQRTIERAARPVHTGIDVQVHVEGHGPVLVETSDVEQRVPRPTGLDDLASAGDVLDDDGPRHDVLLGVAVARVAVAARARRRRDARERRARVRITHDHFERPVAAAAQRLAEELGLAGRRALELLDAIVNKLSDHVLRLDGLDVRLPPVRAAAAFYDSLHVLAQHVCIDDEARRAESLFQSCWELVPRELPGCCGSHFSSRSVEVLCRQRCSARHRCACEAAGVE
mmetsp:Transcript_18595/g.48572  ORF Transcript_18595/g.48572 Transcript_18595/m.48572 type:complete len:256 (+) Transcript_18595:676-1443(+)